jgi:murein DD-endopeptidase MepM/ murein hydrolase activator NlpD
MFFGQRHLCVLVCSIALLGCATASSDTPLHDDHLPGAWHIVKAGETSASIAEKAGIHIEDFLEINGLRKGDMLEPGRPVFLLDDPSYSQGSAKLQNTAPEKNTELSSSPPHAPPSIAPLRWPLAAPRLTSRFGKRWGRDHEGIDMAAPIGTPVLAAAAGTVIYAGDQVRGYGNMIVLRHSDELVTVYAHNSVLRVRIGESVPAGQQIAKVGDTGRSTAPHLHFEVRRKEIPQDPIQFLPALK